MKEKADKQIPRPPVVVVMGHIDHGKSTLLDYIRKTNITEKEAGGITQKISAYEVEVEISGTKRKITFLDTPGHEAFCTVRERGARVADIAVLVISAEDSVKPQTIEALECIKKDKMPFIIAVSKIDKPGANIDKIKQDLAGHDVLVEGWGGTVPFVPISSKSGENIPELLEMIVLQSDLEDFKANPEMPATGFVIESSLNSKQGISATLIIKDGSLKSGAFVATHGAHVKAVIIKNFKGENIREARISDPVKIFGWSREPIVGGEFKTFDSKEEAVAFANEKKLAKSDQAPDDNNKERFLLPLVLKADRAGSLEAIKYELQKLETDKVGIKIISQGIGNISEKDVKTASAKNDLVLGFGVNIDKGTEMLAMRDNIEIKTFKIIYELVDFIKNRLIEAAPTEMVEAIVGKAKILKTFSQNKKNQVVGGRVEEGEIKVGATVKILRREAEIGEGKIKELQVKKIKTGQAKEGEEFGVMIEAKTEMVPGDIVEIREMRKQ